MFENFFPKLISLIDTYSKFLLSGLKNTLIIAASAFLIGLIIGTIIAAIKVIPTKDKNKSGKTLLFFANRICDIYITVIRGTPVVVQLLLMYFAILAKTGLPALVIAIIVFGLNSGAYMAEIMRAGILSVEKGQMEAGRSLGMSYLATMVKIILPQAIKNILPTMLNEFIALLKETSVAGYITVIDVTMATQRIVAREYQALVPYINLALIYLVIVGLLTLFVKLLERRLRVSDKRN